MEAREDLTEEELVEYVAGIDLPGIPVRTGILVENKASEKGHEEAQVPWQCVPIS